MVKKEFVKVISETPGERAEFLPLFPDEESSFKKKNPPKLTPSSGLGGIQPFRIIKL